MTISSSFIIVIVPWLSQVSQPFLVMHLCLQGWFRQLFLDVTLASIIRLLEALFVVSFAAANFV